MVNASEPSMRLRNPGSPKAMVLAASDGPWLGTRSGPRRGGTGDHPPRWDTTAPEYRGHLPQSHLDGAERGNPPGVWSRDRRWLRQASRPTAREEQRPRRTRCPKKRRVPAERRRESITGHIGPRERGDPTRKGADVGQGIRRRGRRTQEYGGRS